MFNPAPEVVLSFAIGCTFLLVGLVTALVSAIHGFFQPKREPGLEDIRSSKFNTMDNNLKPFSKGSSNGGYCVSFGLAGLSTLISLPFFGWCIYLVWFA